MFGPELHNSQGFWGGEKKVPDKVGQMVELAQISLPYPVVVSAHVETEIGDCGFVVEVGVERFKWSRGFLPNRGLLQMGNLSGQPLEGILPFVSEGKASFVAKTARLFAVARGASAGGHTVRGALAVGTLAFEAVAVDAAGGSSSPETVNEANVNQNAASVSLIAANTSFTRRQLWIYNDAAADLLIRLKATASASAFSVRIPPMTLWECPQPVWAGQVDGIWSAAGAGAARITELV